MKRYIYTLCAMAAGLLFSCSEREMDPALDSSQQRVTIKVNVEDEPGSRAASTAPTRYMIQAYDNDQPSFSGAANVFEGGTVDRQTNATGEFEMIIDRTKNYIFLLWADVNGQDVYTITDLNLSVKLLTGKNPVESWSSEGGVAIQKSAVLTPTLEVTLKRAVSRLTLKETGKLKINSKLVTTFNQPTGLNFSFGTVLSGSAARTETINCLTAVDGTTTAVDLTEAAGVTDGKPIYVFSPSDVASVNELTFKLDAEDAFLVSNVPLRANFKTNIIGHFTSIAAKDITIKGDDTWESPDIEVPAPKAGDYVYKDKTYSPTYTADAQNPVIGVVVSSRGLAAKVLSFRIVEDSDYGAVGPAGEDISGAHSDDDGESNTASIVAETIYGADWNVIDFCTGITDGGLRWYSPAINELLEIRANKAVIDAALVAAGQTSIPNSAAYSSTFTDAGTVKTLNYADGSIVSKSVVGVGQLLQAMAKVTVTEKE